MAIGERVHSDLDRKAAWESAVLEFPWIVERTTDDRDPNSGTQIASAADYAYCAEVMRKASKNYSFASAFLPAENRPHVEALYALLRVGDDRVDVSHEGFDSPLEAIDDWERTYWKAFETGASDHPVMRAYLDTAIKFRIPVDTMVAYFRAMKEDLIYTRFPTFADLLHYMDTARRMAVPHLPSDHRRAARKDPLPALRVVADPVVFIYVGYV